MKLFRKLLVAGLAVCLLQMPAMNAFAEGNILQNQAVNGGVINQNIVFVDVKVDHWAREAISDMARRGVINGYEDETFKPENSISREEFAKLIAMTFSLNLPEGKSTYSDIPADRWSAKYIEAAKDYLTGYYPPQGIPFFSPESRATREDVAVALVKVLGLKETDLKNESILQRKFTDADSVSYGLRKYVALAIERGLLSGYADNTFRPEDPITRAEVATLLYRTIKSSAKDQNDGPSLQVDVPATTGSGTFYVSGKVSDGASVAINGEEVEVVNGAFKEGYRLEKEGTHEIVIVAKYVSGKSTAVTKTITYKADGPVLIVDDIPATTTSDSIKLSGKVEDKTDYNPVVYINDEKIDNWGNYFSKTVKLAEGENIFVIKAKNSAGQTTTVTKKIVFTLGGPTLKIDDIPETTTSKTVRVSGKVEDKNDSYPTVYLNDEKISNNWGGMFEKTVTLQDGENLLVFKAKNSAGKVTIVTKTITLNLGGPKLIVDDIPAVTETPQVKISGKVEDKNDTSPVVYINDERITNWGFFDKTVTLKEGENILVIKAKNSEGKTTVVTKTIVFQPPAPVLKINYIPERSTSKTLNVSGNVSDKNDSRPLIYLNDEKISDSWSNSFSKNVTLQTGENNLVFKAINSYGKETTVTKSVYY